MARRGGFLSRIPPVIRWTILVLVALWLPFLATPRAPFWQLLALHDDVFRTGQVWQLVSYMALHDPRSPMHVLVNAYGLWLFGRELEQSWGSLRFLRFMLACGVIAGLIHVLMSRLLGGVPPVIGISGALFGVMVAFAMTWPRRKLQLLIPPMPVEARWIVLVYALIAFVTAWDESSGIANFAHLGGALAGWFQVQMGRTLYRRGFKLPSLPSMKDWSRRRRKSRMRVVVEDKEFDAWLKDNDEDLRH